MEQKTCPNWVTSLVESQTIGMSKLSRELSAEIDIVNLSLGEPILWHHHIWEAAKKAIDDLLHLLIRRFQGMGIEKKLSLPNSKEKK